MEDKLVTRDAMSADEDLEAEGRAEAGTGCTNTANDCATTSTGPNGNSVPASREQALYQLARPNPIGGL